ncbi:MAG TPA: hypothetical protein VGM84_01450 [Steroidobacteraceae bacterium]
MSDIAIVTARAARGLDEDQPPLQAAFRAVGAHVAVVDWDDPEVDWTRFDLALLRSTWDYTDRLPEFLSWVERVAGRTRMANPAAIVRWNTDKHYLAELARKGVATVPSTFVEPGEDAGASLDRFISGLVATEWVVKPSVGAGSRDTNRYKRSARDAAVAHAQRLLAAGRSVLLQPYLERVDEHGETAMIFFGGRFSHAIRKGPLLPPGPQPGVSCAATELPGTPANGLFIPEDITPRQPSDAELHLAAEVLSALPFPAPLYARVDLIQDDHGAPALLELELTEPSLFFTHAPGSALRFAKAVLGHISLPLNT